MDTHNIDPLIQRNFPHNTPLEDALIDWGLQAGVTVMMNTETVGRQLTPSVNGTLSARTALGLLL